MPAQDSIEGVADTGPLFGWMQRRAAGVLLHPTSLPGAQGIGVLDGAIDAWLEFLAAAGIAYWQVCPLGPTGYGDSPYQCFSAFAGNPYLIDLRALKRAGLLTEADLSPFNALPRERVDFGWLYATKWSALFRAFENFKSHAHREPARPLPYGDFEEFRTEQRSWLDAFSLFQALKDHHHPKPWWEWPDEVRFYAKTSQARLPKSVILRAEAHAFFQYLFFGQWRQVRHKAARLGVKIIGDAPIFVARDSADVWANPQLFQIDQITGHPIFVAGVPPDYFSADGQLWGNPLYAWEIHAGDSYAWWISRLRTNFLVCDVLRIDHFRGFDTYWSIPAVAKTAKTGSWQPGPGLAFFRAVRDAMPGARLIAEDLGELLPSVIALREATGLPGMAILQFAFGGDAGNAYLPHHQRTNSVVYPGTHDNDTTLGWYASADEKTRDHVRRYLRVSGAEVGWDFIRASYASTGRLAIVSLQDLLSLGSEARFNTPGVAAGNWQWRYRAEQLEKLHRESAGYLRELAGLYDRLGISKAS
jgi:4-alpha-glucanotransferase